MDLNSETQLVEAARNGHLESFGALYERYHSPMVALAYSMLADRDLAEDAAQEVFAIACRDIGSLKSKERFAAWLAGICRNISRQMLRAGKSRGIAPDNEPAVVRRDRFGGPPGGDSPGRMEPSRARERADRYALFRRILAGADIGSYEHIVTGSERSAGQSKT